MVSTDRFNSSKGFFSIALKPIVSEIDNLVEEFPVVSFSPHLVCNLLNLF